MDRVGELGEFLRTRRARVSPALAGIDDGAGRRRVPGLRREELARLVHVSSDYLARLEQGRVGRPSPQIVDALAGALRLDPIERRHLYRLAAAAEPAAEAGDGTEVRPGLALLVRTLEPSPAVLLSRRLELLVWNPAGEALLGPFPEERSYARIVFDDPATRALYVDWAQAARETIAMLRFAAARHPADAALAAVIADLCARSDAADEWWSAHDVAQKRHGAKRLDHPLVGELTVQYEALLLADDGDQILTIFTAEPGTRDGDRLAALTSA